MNVLMALLFSVIAGAQTPATAAKDGGIDGKKLYAAKCATCHGTDAKGKAAMAKMFKLDPAKLDLQGGEAAKKKDAELIALITSGKDKMPAFKGKLKDAEITAVVVYIRSMPKIAAAAATDKK